MQLEVFQSRPRRRVPVQRKERSPGATSSLSGNTLEKFDADRPGSRLRQNRFHLLNYHQRRRSSREPLVVVFVSSANENKQIAPSLSADTQSEEFRLISRDAVESFDLLRLFRTNRCGFLIKTPVNRNANYDRRQKTMTSLVKVKVKTMEF